MNRLAKIVVMVAMMSATFARIAPKVQYDEAQAFVTLPVNLSTNVDSFLRMGEQVVSVLAGDRQPINILLKGYVTSRSTMRESLHVQYILQRLERRMHEAMPNSVFATDFVEEVPGQNLLPAWRMSGANTIPSAYIAIIVQPTINP